MMKFIKGTALLTPFCLGVALLAIVLKAVFWPTPTAEGTNEILMTTGLTMIGIAITVWVGLNIYNLVEKKQVEELVEKHENINKEMVKVQEEIESFIDKMRKLWKSNKYYTDASRALNNAKTEKSVIKKLKKLASAIYKYKKFIELIIDVLNQVPDEILEFIHRADLVILEALNDDTFNKDDSNVNTVIETLKSIDEILELYYGTNPNISGITNIKITYISYTKKINNKELNADILNLISERIRKGEAKEKEYLAKKNIYIK